MESNYATILKGSKKSLCAHGWAGQAQHLLSWRRILQSEIRNSASAKKTESESEGGQKFLPPNPLPFCPPERSVSAAQSAAINRSFVQNRFELRSAIATNQNLTIFQDERIARSPRLRRVSLRKKPCISELNRKVGQIQIQCFGKTNGGSACKARNPANGISNFFHSARGGTQNKFLIPRFGPKATL
jgi:hypothetical protein